MYEADWAARFTAWRNASVGATRPRVSRNVWAISATSFLTDVSSEMITSILGIYLAVQLGFGPMAIGAIDGLYQGLTTLSRWMGGIAADARGASKLVAGFGYGLSAVCKLGWLAAGGRLGALGIVLALDRTGKAVRTAPRDALIAHSTERDQLGMAFGVHRAFDAAGAMLGPVVAFTVLTLAPRRFDAVFVVSFCVAVVGVAVFVCFVRNVAPADDASAAREPSSAIGRVFAPGVVVVLVTAGVLATATVSETLLYLVLRQQHDFDARYLPLLYTATASCYLAGAAPLGRLADRTSRLGVFLAGHGLLAIGYLVPALPLPLAVAAPVLVICTGGYYASTDGVLAAMASAVLPPGVRATGLAVLATCTSAGRFAASLLFARLWTWYSPESALLVFAAVLACLTLGTATIVRRRVRALIT